MLVSVNVIEAKVKRTFWLASVEMEQVSAN